MTLYPSKSWKKLWSWLLENLRFTIQLLLLQRVQLTTSRSLLLQLLDVPELLPK